jgi:hypothetical protein
VNGCAASLPIMVGDGRCIASTGAVGISAIVRWFDANPAAPGVGDASLVGIRWMAISRSSPPCRFVVGWAEEIAVMVGLRDPIKRRVIEVIKGLNLGHTSDVNWHLSAF